MTHLFEHYRFTGNKSFLQETALPIMKGLVEFFNAFLIEKDGYLVTAPSLSPENSYVTPSNVTEAISIGPTSDNQVSPDWHFGTFHAIVHQSKLCPYFILMLSRHLDTSRLIQWLYPCI